MPTKRQLQEELEKLRQELEENCELMRAAALKAEDMMALQSQYEALKEEFERLKRGRRLPGSPPSLSPRRKPGPATQAPPPRIAAKNGRLRKQA